MNICWTKIGLVAAGIALTASAMLSQEVGYLDLTDPAPRHRIRNPNGGTGGFCGGSESSAIPEVTLTLVSVDKRAYSMGEEVTFEIRVENTDKQNIEIPWTPHLGDLEPGDSTQSYTYQSAVVGLILTDPDSHRSVDLYGYFYGSADVPGTIRELRPSQSVLIRARRKVETYEDWWVKRVQEVRPLPLKASPALMLSTVIYSPNENGDLLSASENSHCTLLNTKKANQLDVAVWPRSSK
jgi:hypothetical protein